MLETWAVSDLESTKLLANLRCDARQDATSRSEGWRVLRVWEHKDPLDAADRVERQRHAWWRIATSRATVGTRRSTAQFVE